MEIDAKAQNTIWMYQVKNVTLLIHKWKLHFKTGTVIGKCITVNITIGNYKKSNEINLGFI